MRDSKDWIQTYGGRRLWPADPRPGDFDIIDIARALSMLCRFNGHVRTFYSVAEHSLRVSLACDPADALAGLLHDADEAYIADVTRPVKRQDFMSGYRIVQGRLQAAIFAEFGLPPEIPASVHRADEILLRAEAIAIKSPLDPEWEAWLGGIPDVGIAIEPMPPSLAESLFLARFAYLMNPADSGLSQTGLLASMLR